MADDIPQWAKERACEHLRREGSPHAGTVENAENFYKYSFPALARYISAHEEEPAHAYLGLACGAVADAVFYHNSDRHQRAKLALALVDLAQEIQRGKAQKP